MQRVTDVLAQIERDRESVEFLSTGWGDIDEWLDGGFMRKELIVIGGATGIGKSYIAGQVMWTIAQKGFNTAYFSLEISNKMVLSRLMGALANIKPTRITSGFLTAEEHQKRLEARAKVLVYEQYMAFYDDVYTFAHLEEEIYQNSYDFIVVDFVQNIMVTGMEEYQRLSHVALSLQKLAKEKNCCILLLSQLSNAASRDKDDSAPVEYKGSGSIATVCDLGFVVTRTTGWDAGENAVRLFLRKNRRGPSGKYFDHTFVIPGGWIK